MKFVHIVLVLVQTGTAGEKWNPPMPNRQSESPKRARARHVRVRPVVRVSRVRGHLCRIGEDTCRTSTQRRLSELKNSSQVESVRREETGVWSGVDCAVHGAVVPFDVCANCGRTAPSPSVRVRVPLPPPAPAPRPGAQKWPLRAAPADYTLPHLRLHTFALYGSSSPAPLALPHPLCTEPPSLRSPQALVPAPVLKVCVGWGDPRCASGYHPHSKYSTSSSLLTSSPTTWAGIPSCAEPGPESQMWASP